MHILLIGLFIIIGIVVAIFLLVGILILKLKKAAREYGYFNLKSLYNDIKQSSYDSFNKEKSIGSQTNLLLPKILKDIPNFSIDEIYRKTETGLRAAFNSLENRTYFLSKTGFVFIFSSPVDKKINSIFLFFENSSHKFD